MSQAPTLTEEERNAAAETLAGVTRAVYEFILKNHYRTPAAISAAVKMPVSQVDGALAALASAGLAEATPSKAGVLWRPARGDCLLWLWATHPMLPQALEVMAAWRCRYVTSGVWVKRTARGKLGFGTGYRLRSASEPFLIGTFGNPESTRSIRTVIEGPLRDHSEKPDEAYAAAERMMPGAFRADLFSKRTRPGWDAWGAGAGAPDAKYQSTDEKEQAA